ncbi:MAG: kelch repeat-containing protein [Myxococcales bacterium]|nr:kelch repeat-containing protein [Myxococcales bacterium]
MRQRLVMTIAWLLLAACNNSAPTGGPDLDVDLGPAPDLGPGAGSWRSLASLPAPQQECGVVALGGELYVVGGFGRASERLDRVVVYEPSADRWRDAAKLPVALHHPNIAVHGGKIYVLGSLRGFEFRADGASFVYDPALDSWGDGPSMTAGRERGGGAAVTVGDAIYVFGGLRSGAKAEADRLDVNAGTWTVLAEMPDVADHLAGGLIGEKVYLAGGRDGSIAAHRASLLIYDPQRDAYDRGPAMPTSRAGLAAAVAGAKLFVFGGEGNSAHPSGVFDHNEAFDPATGAWSTLAPIKTRRHGTGAATIDGRIYLPGGAALQAFGASDVHEVFTP